MDLFVLDSQLRRTALFDLYESLIWTERFQAYGDFELVIPSTQNARTQLVSGTNLAINGSSRVMTIETVLDKKDSEGRVYLTVSGPSLEKTLDDRVAKTLVPNADLTDLNWYFTDQLPAEIIRNIFNYIAVLGSIDVGDKIPFYTPGTIYPTSTIPEPTTTVTLNIPPMSLYSAIQQLCSIYDLGFRLVRNGDTSQLMFNIYAGSDRTTLQLVNDPVIFSPELDNLLDVAYLSSVANYKNVADVISPDGSTFVYADYTDPTVAGFERKVLYVDASSIRYARRSDIFPAPYVVTEDQLAAIKITQDLPQVTDAQSKSLDKLAGMERLTADDIANITATVGVVYGLLPGESASITYAVGLASTTQDQKDALNKLNAGTRLDSSEITAVRQFLANNTVATTPNKNNISNAQKRQEQYASAAEQTAVQAAKTTNVAYNSTEDAALLALLIQKGKEELAKNTNFAAFDGEASKNSQYIYEQHYYLGDLVEIRNADKVSQQMRVTEQIFASDVQGDRKYPTLAVKQLITPGSWYSWPAAATWDDATTETWDSV